jgi:hypothetical protein
MRKRLLKHPARMGVEYETVREVDKEYAEALRQSGIPTTAIQRGAMKFGNKLGAATSEPLDPKDPHPTPATAHGRAAVRPRRRRRREGQELARPGAPWGSRAGHDHRHRNRRIAANASRCANVNLE